MDISEQIGLVGRGQSDASDRESGESAEMGSKSLLGSCEWCARCSERSERFPQVPWSICAICTRTLVCWSLDWFAGAKPNCSFLDPVLWIRAYARKKLKKQRKALSNFFECENLSLHVMCRTESDRGVS